MGPALADEHFPIMSNSWRKRAVNKNIIVRVLTLIGAALTLLLGFGIASVAGAAVGPVQVTTVSPYTACTVDNVGSQSGFNFPNSEVEPHLAVNANNPMNLV